MRHSICLSDIRFAPEREMAAAGPMPMMRIVAASEPGQNSDRAGPRIGIERAHDIFVSTANKVTICSYECGDSAMRVVSNEDARIINCDIVLEQLY